MPNQSQDNFNVSDDHVGQLDLVSDARIQIMQF